MRLLWLQSRRNRGPVDGVGGSCWKGVLVGQCAVVWLIGGVTVVLVHGSSHQLKRQRVDIAWSWALLVFEGALVMELEMSCCGA